MEIHIDIAVLIAVILVIRLRRATEPRSRTDEMLTVVLAVTLGLLLVGTATGTALLGLVNGLAETVGAN